MIWQQKLQVQRPRVIFSQSLFKLSNTISMWCTEWNTASFIAKLFSLWNAFFYIEFFVCRYINELLRTKPKQIFSLPSKWHQFTFIDNILLKIIVNAFCSHANRIENICRDTKYSEWLGCTEIHLLPRDCSVFLGYCLCMPFTISENISHIKNGMKKKH